MNFVSQKLNFSLSSVLLIILYIFYYLFKYFFLQWNGALPFHLAWFFFVEIKLIAFAMLIKQLCVGGVQMIIYLFISMHLRDQSTFQMLIYMCVNIAALLTKRSEWALTVLLQWPWRHGCVEVSGTSVVVVDGISVGKSLETIIFC